MIASTQVKPQYQKTVVSFFVKGTSIILLIKSLIWITTGCSSCSESYIDLPVWGKGWDLLGAFSIFSLCHSYAAKQVAYWFVMLGNPCKSNQYKKAEGLNTFGNRVEYETLYTNATRAMHPLLGLYARTWAIFSPIFTVTSCYMLCLSLNRGEGTLPNNCFIFCSQQGTTRPKTIRVLRSKCSAMLWADASFIW